ncbi:MAG: hypothetical protein QM607_07930 [Microbacterium sp.]
MPSDISPDKPQRVGAALPQRTPPPKHAVRFLVIWMAVGLVLGGGALLGANLGLPGWIMPIAIVVLIAAVAVPLLIGGWWIGRALRSGAGLLGSLFAGGVAVAGYAWYAQSGWYALAGWGTMLLTGVALYVLVCLPQWRAQSARKQQQAMRAAQRAERRAAAVKRGTSVRR